MAWNPNDWKIIIIDIVSVSEFTDYLKPNKNLPTSINNEQISYALKQATQYINNFLNGKVFDTLDLLDNTNPNDIKRVQHLKMAIMYTAEYFLNTSRIFASITQAMSGSTPFSISRDSFVALVEVERPDIINELNAGRWVDTFYTSSLGGKTNCECSGLSTDIINFITNYLNKNYLPLFDAPKHPMQSDLDMNHHKILNVNLVGVQDKELRDNVKVRAGLSIDVLGKFINSARRLATDEFVLAETVRTLLAAQSYTRQQINQALASVFTFKGHVPTYNDLPTTNIKIGDAYLVDENKILYAWDGGEWIDLGSTQTSFGIQDITMSQNSDGSLDLLKSMSDGSNYPINIKSSNNTIRTQLSNIGNSWQVDVLTSSKVVYYDYADLSTYTDGDMLVNAITPIIQKYDEYISTHNLTNADCGIVASLTKHGRHTRGLNVLSNTSYDDFKNKWVNGSQSFTNSIPLSIGQRHWENGGGNFFMWDETGLYWYYSATDKRIYVWNCMSQWQPEVGNNPSDSITTEPIPRAFFTFTFYIR